MKNSKKSRREFFKQTVTAVAAVPVLSTFNFNVVTKKAKEGSDIIGHGDFKYKVDKKWGLLDPTVHPVKDCHEMIMDSKGRLIMITNETKNNIIVYDKSGKLLDTWGHDLPGGHGLTLWKTGGEDFLFMTDYELGKVHKTTIDGRVLMTIDHPSTIGVYKQDDPFKPTETAIGSNGDIYVADGYGSNFILQYDSKGQFIRKFGGKGDNDDQFQTAHGVCIDMRDKSNPILVCTSRAHNSFKRFTLDGKYVSTLFLPGAFVCRAVIDDDHIYSGVCWSRLKYLNQTPNSGFVTILDKNDRVVSNPGGTAPEYHHGELQLMVQDKPIFMHCHDVCVDNDKNLYVCQWNANKTYPIRLLRV